MFDSDEMLLVARDLLYGENASDSHRRRAVSTAYYAVFHAIARTASLRFVGPGSETTVAYRLLYRSFDHGNMRSICKELDKEPMAKAIQLRIGRSAVTPATRNLAHNFVDLQQARHIADYDPAAAISAEDVADLIEEATMAIVALLQIPLPEQADVLALMMVKARP